MSSRERENRYLDGWTKKGPAFFIQIDTCINQAQPRKLDEVEVSFIQAIWDSISFTCSSSIFYLLLTFLSPLENESIFEKKAHLDIPFHNRLDFDFMKRLYVFRKISPTSKHTSDVVGDFQTRNSAHWWMLIVARRLKWRW